MSSGFSVLAQIVELNSVQLCREGEGATGVAHHLLFVAQKPGVEEN